MVIIIIIRRQVSITTPGHPCRCLYAEYFRGVHIKKGTADIKVPQYIYQPICRILNFKIVKENVVPVKE